METFFTSDTHFGHKKIIEHCARPFKSVEEMNEAIINRWNSVVNPKDLIYVLGDFSFVGVNHTKEILKCLNGFKVLIRGNHDHNFKSFEKADELGFDAMFYEANIELGPHRVILSHYPYRDDRTVDARYVDRRPKDNGLWLLHGHVHEFWKIRPESREINVGVDVWNFTPVNSKVLEEIITNEKATNNEGSQEKANA